jgi:hypothetical protein
VGAVSKIKIFHHIPKCAGTAFRTEFLAQNFKIIDDYRDACISPTDAMGYGPPINVELMADNAVLCGHFEGRLIGSPMHSIENRYPVVQLKDASYVFTILRDPLEMAVSMFYYEIRVGARYSDPDDYNALIEVLIEKKNYVSRLMNVESADAIDDRLNMYSFVGVSERYAETCTSLASILGVQFTPRADYTNKTPRSPLLDDKLQANMDYISSLYREGNLDYLIYDKALSRFAKLA